MLAGCQRLKPKIQQQHERPQKTRG